MAISSISLAGTVGMVGRQGVASSVGGRWMSTCLSPGCAGGFTAPAVEHVWRLVAGRTGGPRGDLIKVFPSPEIFVLCLGVILKSPRKPPGSELWMSWAIIEA